MRLFGLKTCDTCRKARKAIEAAGRDVEYIDVRADGIEPTDLEQIIQHFGEAAINRSSTTWRGLSPDERETDIQDLLVAHPTLMKRPVIVQDDVWTIGWKPDVQQQVLGD